MLGFENLYINNLIWLSECSYSQSQKSVSCFFCRKKFGFFLSEGKIQIHLKLFPSMTFWCIQTKSLTSQLQVEEATWRKCDVLNHRTTMKCHLTLKKHPEVWRGYLNATPTTTVFESVMEKLLLFWPVWLGPCGFPSTRASRTMSQF